MSLQCVVVTPEKTELDESVDSVVLPMFDGELGVQTGRAPMIGRLGYGVLRLTTGSGTQRYYVDGGFAQIEDNVVNVLTGTMTPVDKLDAAKADEDLEKALSMDSKTPAEASLKETAVLRARGRRRAVTAGR